MKTRPRATEIATEIRPKISEELLTWARATLCLDTQNRWAEWIASVDLKTAVEQRQKLVEEQNPQLADFDRGMTLCRERRQAVLATIERRRGAPDEAAFNRALQARLRRLREQANLTQTDVAEALGMPSRSYQHFEARSPLPAYLIPAFAEIVGCSIEDVLIGP